MRVITYRITLLEATLVTALEGDPNEGASFDYLPGSVLRGVIIGKYLRANNLTELDAANADVRRLFFDGRTRYLNGYPLDRLDKRTLPTPLSWQHEKGNEVDIFDFAIETPDKNDRQWQGVGKPFCSLGEPNGGVQKIRLVQPDRHIAVHTARTRRFGRAMPAEKIDPSRGDLQGAVYRYDALEAGQTFEAMILCDDSDVTNLKSWLTGEAKLGGSRSGGYGRARLEVVEDESVEDWRETGGTLTCVADGKLIITLVSDALLRDRIGQFAVDPCVVTHALSQRLGVPMTLQRAFLRGEPIGGFNRKWGLPLPQALAVKMGSVFVYDTPASNISHKLRELEALGIGERRAEGFGRVALNWHTEAELRVDEEPVPPTPPTALTITEPSSRALAQRMAQRLLRRRLDERLVAKTNEIRILNPPSNAQLSRLRNILHDELMKASPDPQRVREFLNRVRERNAARKQFERARIGDTRLLKWLDDTLQITDENAWKSLLGFRTEDARKVGGVEATLTDGLRTEYVLRLIDAVLARAAKKSRKEGR